MRCCPISDLYRSFLKNYGDPTARSYRPPPAPEDKLNATADATKAHRIFQLRQLLTDPGNGEDSTKKRANIFCMKYSQINKILSLFLESQLM